MTKLVKISHRRGGKMRLMKKLALQAVMRGETVTVVRRDGDTMILRPTERLLPHEPPKLAELLADKEDNR